jgi:hypothetical protein
MAFVHKTKMATFERASTPRRLAPRRACEAALPRAAVVHAALALLGCRRAPLPDLQPDPAALPIPEAAARERSQLTIEQIVPFETQLETMGAGPRVVPFEVQPTRVTVHVIAPGVVEAEAAVRKMLPALRHCGAFVKESQKLTMKLRVGTDGEVSDDEATPNSDDSLTPKASHGECVRRTLASMKIAGGPPNHPEIELEVELAPAGPSFRESHR